MFWPIGGTIVVLGSLLAWLALPVPPGALAGFVITGIGLLGIINAAVWAFRQYIH